MNDPRRVTQLAVSAAAIFLSACRQEPTQTPEQGVAAAEQPKATAARIKCFGVNECAGQGACDVPDNRVAAGSKGHSCAGQNECKGKGWILMAADECSEKGGEPV